MAKRGPKSKRADGFHVTKKGYLRGTIDGRTQLAHVAAWERAYGPLPAGFQVHPRNENKQDNSLDNLRLVSPTEHKRIHSRCELRNGIWWKPCRLCGEFKPIIAEYWYLSLQGWPLYGRCRPCHVAKVVQEKRLRKVRRGSR